MKKYIQTSYLQEEWLSLGFVESLNIPKDWAICDGTKGTPDLRNRFIIGQSQEISFGSIGGSSSIVLSKSNLPQLGCGRFSADSHSGSYHHFNNNLLDIMVIIQLILKRVKMVMIGAPIMKLISILGWTLLQLI